MNRRILVLATLFCAALTVVAQQKDDRDCKDHPLFTRMPNSWIHSCAEKEFDGFAFSVAKGKTEQVEGRFWRTNYYPQATIKTRPSELQILRNFENAVKKMGGSVVWVEKSKETLKLTRDGKEFWVQVSADFTGKYQLLIVEKQAMSQDIEVNADALMDDLRTSGHAAVYGIYFDTGKSDLKPESEQAIGEIGKLLKKDGNLKIFVVGHTDNVGGLESNMKLSQDRAAAVIHTLAKNHGIAAARMKAFGNGPYAPVSANDTEEGKARNRRVELVKQ